MTAGRTDLAIAAFEMACVSLLIAAIFDTFDGMIARQLGATSEFGKEYDSLADVVTFGTAPPSWSTPGVCTARQTRRRHRVSFPRRVSLRLARFNVMTGKTDYRYFVGLPSPAGALTLASMIYYAPSPMLDRPFAIVILLLTACMAFAMVSRSAGARRRGSTSARAIADVHRRAGGDRGLGFAWPRPFVLVFAISYLASGPLLRLWSIAFPSRKVDDVLEAAPQ